MVRIKTKQVLLRRLYSHKRHHQLSLRKTPQKSTKFAWLYSKVDLCMHSTISKGMYDKDYFYQCFSSDKASEWIIL